jgi:hypothetical protein
MFKPIPSTFKLFNSGKGYTEVFDLNKNLIAVKVVLDRLSGRTKELIRLQLKTLFKGYNPLDRKEGWALFESQMKAYGSMFYHFGKGESQKLSFYTYKKEKLDLFKTIDARDKFKEVIEKHTHAELAENLLGIFLWLCPKALTSFSKFSDPFLSGDDYKPSSLKKDVGLDPPFAYQLYVTKDYCSQIHRDKDLSTFTLMYVSHPNTIQGATPVDFILATDSGSRARVVARDADLVAFDSSVLRGTAFRTPKNVAYVGCTVVNSSLGHLMRRWRT